MKRLVEGLTPSEFISIANSNLIELAAINNVSPYSALTSTSDYITALNTDFGSSKVNFGQTGLNFKNSFEKAFIDDVGGLVDPSGVSSIWINDYAKIDFTDNTNGVAQHEIYEAIGMGTYSLVTTLAKDVTTYNNYTSQNQSMNFKVRAKNGNINSSYSSIVNIITPLVFKTNQNNLNQIIFYQLMMQAGKSINIDWGDGTNTNYSQSEYVYNELYHDYSITKDPYYIIISGDVNYIRAIQFMTNGSCYGDLSKWKLPDTLFFFHFYTHNFTGDISGWVLPSGIQIFQIAGNHFSGDLTNVNWASIPTLFDFHLSGNNFTGDISGWNWHNPWRSTAVAGHINLATNNFIGDISNWVFGANTTWICIYGNKLTGNLANWVFPPTMSSIQLTATVIIPQENNFIGDVSGWVFPTTVIQADGFFLDCAYLGLSGDLSNAIIPEGKGDQSIKRLDFEGNHLTKLPYGSFKDVDIYNFSKNSCNSAEIDRILGVIDSYFTGEVFPLNNCIYTLNGTGMGIPSSVGLASRTSILGKYTAAGKTCSILINS
jgi:hypothetical protein